MSVNKFLKGIISILILACSANATYVGSIGFVSPEYPVYGNRLPSEDTAEFFDDLVENAYYTLGDAAIAVVNRININKNDIHYRDILYKDRFLIPSEENEDIIAEFYKNKRRRFLSQLADQNKVDFILFSKFNRVKLKKALRGKENPAILMFDVFAYQKQSGATSVEHVILKVSDLLTLPDYDPDEMQTKFEEKYIKMFQEIFGALKTTGSEYSSTSTSTSTSTTATSTITTPKQSKEEKKAARKQEQIDAAEEATDGDW